MRDPRRLSTGPPPDPWEAIENELLIEQAERAVAARPPAARPKAEAGDVWGEVEDELAREFLSPAGIPAPDTVAAPPVWPTAPEDVQPGNAEARALAQRLRDPRARTRFMADQAETAARNAPKTLPEAPPALAPAPPPSPYRRLADAFRAADPFAEGVRGREIASAQIDVEARERGLTREAYIDQAVPELRMMNRLDRVAQAFRGGTVQAVQGTVGGVGALTGIQSLKDISADLEGVVREATSDDPSFAERAAAGLGTTAAYLAPGLAIARGATALAGLSPRLAQVLGTGYAATNEAFNEAMPVFEDAYNTAIASGLDPDTARRTAAQAASTSFWLNVGVIWMGDKAGYFSDAAGGNSLRRMFRTGQIEGVTEMFQSDANAFALTGDLASLKERLDAYLIGTIAGAGFQGAREVLGAGPGRAPVPEQAIPSAPAPGTAPSARGPSGAELPLDPWADARRDPTGPVGAAPTRAEPEVILDPAQVVLQGPTGMGETDPVVDFIRHGPDAISIETSREVFDPPEFAPGGPRPGGLADALRRPGPGGPITAEDLAGPSLEELEGLEEGPESSYVAPEERRAPGAERRAGERRGGGLERRQGERRAEPQLEMVEGERREGDRRAADRRTGEERREGERRGPLGPDERRQGDRRQTGLLGALADRRQVDEGELVEGERRQGERRAGERRVADGTYRERATQETPPPARAAQGEPTVDLSDLEAELAELEAFGAAAQETDERRGLRQAQAEAERAARIAEIRAELERGSGRVRAGERRQGERRRVLAGRLVEERRRGAVAAPEEGPAVQPGRRTGEERRQGRLTVDEEAALESGSIEAKIGRLEKVDAPQAPTARQATEATYGAPRPGFVRLYRGEVDPATVPPDAVPDWVRAAVRDRFIEASFGRWFTTDPVKAEWYRQDATVQGKAAGTGAKGRLVFVDVPAEVADASTADQDPWARQFALDADEYFLPVDVLGQAKPVPYQGFGIGPRTPVNEREGAVEPYRGAPPSALARPGTLLERIRERRTGERRQGERRETPVGVAPADVGERRGFAAPAEGPVVPADRRRRERRGAPPEPPTPPSAPAGGPDTTATPGAAGPSTAPATPLTPTPEITPGVERRIEQQEKAAGSLDVVAYGNPTTLAMPDGRRLKARWAVVRLRDLITSHTDTFQKDTRFPKEYQPRARETAGAKAQVVSLAGKIDFEQLAESPTPDKGAPIVSRERFVLSGNGRTMAARRAERANSEKWQAYGRELRTNAARFGLDAKPLDGGRAADAFLVRVLEEDLDPQDLADFTRQAQKSGVARMSAADQAQADATVLTPDLMARFAPGASGELDVAQNLPFIREFLKKAAGEDDLADLMTSDGTKLSQAGKARLRNALFAKAFTNREAIERLAESPDDNIRNVTNALLRNLGRFAAVRTRMEAGDLFRELDLSEDLVAAAEQLSRLRAEGTTVRDYLNQQTLGARPLTPFQESLLTTIDAFGRSAKALGTIFDAYLEAVETAGSPKQGGLFGAAPTPDKGAVWRAALAAAGEDLEGGPDLFAPPKVAGPGTAGEPPTVPTPAPAPQGAPAPGPAATPPVAPERTNLVQSGTTAVRVETGPVATPNDAPAMQGQAHLVLLGCTDGKLNRKAKAKDLYNSVLGQGRRRYAEAVHARHQTAWAFLSGKHRIVDPDDELAPYDEKLPTRAEDLNAWRVSTASEIVNRLARIRGVGQVSGSVVEIHAGREYVEPLKSRLAEDGVIVATPLESKAIGQQLAWYKQVGQASLTEGLDPDLDQESTRVARELEAAGVTPEALTRSQAIDRELEHLSSYGRNETESFEAKLKRHAARRDALAAENPTPYVHFRSFTPFMGARGAVTASGQVVWPSWLHAELYASVTGQPLKGKVRKAAAATFGVKGEQLQRLAKIYAERVELAVAEQFLAKGLPLDERSHRDQVFVAPAETTLETSGRPKQYRRLITVDRRPVAVAFPDVPHLDLYEFALRERAAPRPLVIDLGRALGLNESETRLAIQRYRGIVEALARQVAGQQREIVALPRHDEAPPVPIAGPGVEPPRPPDEGAAARAAVAERDEALDYTEPIEVEFDDGTAVPLAFPSAVERDFFLVGQGGPVEAYEDPDTIDLVLKPATQAVIDRVRAKYSVHPGLTDQNLVGYSFVYAQELTTFETGMWQGQMEDEIEPGEPLLAPEPVELWLQDQARLLAQDEETAKAARRAERAAKKAVTPKGVGSKDGFEYGAPREPRTPLGGAVSSTTTPAGHVLSVHKVGKEYFVADERGRVWGGGADLTTAVRVAYGLHGRVDAEMAAPAEGDVAELERFGGEPAPPTVSQPEAPSTPTPSERLEQAKGPLTKEGRDAALERIKKKTDPGTLRAGLPLDTLPDYLYVAGYHFQEGARKFAVFAAKMAEDLGEVSKSVLAALHRVFVAGERSGIKFTPEILQTLGRVGARVYQAGATSPEAFEGQMKAVLAKTRVFDPLLGDVFATLKAAADPSFTVEPVEDPDAREPERRPPAPRAPRPAPPPRPASPDAGGGDAGGAAQGGGTGGVAGPAPGTPDAGPGVVAGDRAGAGAGRAGAPADVQPAPRRGLPPSLRDRRFSYSAEQADDFEAASRADLFAPAPLRAAPGRNPHPRLIVKTRSLAGAPLPALDYQLLEKGFVADAYARGLLSDQQLDYGVLAALQANARGHGYLAAADVGVGKTRIGLATAAEWLEKGDAKRILYVTASDVNVEDVKAEAELLAGDGRFPATIVKVQDYPKSRDLLDQPEPLPAHDKAIYIIDRFGLRTYRKALGAMGLDAAIGDEAHLYKNIAGSATGEAWQYVQVQILQRRGKFLYLTATPATDIHDLEHLVGLREWLPGQFQDWVDQITGAVSKPLDRDEAQAYETDTGLILRALAALAKRGDSRWTSELLERFKTEVTSELGAMAKPPQNPANRRWLKKRLRRYYQQLLDVQALLGGDDELAKVGGLKGRRGRRIKTDAFTTHVTPAEMEQVMRELAIRGKYDSIDLWRKGVEFGVHEEAPTAQEAETFNAYVDFIRDLADKFETFHRQNPGTAPFGIRSMLQFETKRRLFDIRLTRSIAAATAALARGEQPVISAIHYTAGDPAEGYIPAAIRMIPDWKWATRPDGSRVKIEIPGAKKVKEDLHAAWKAFGAKWGHPRDAVKLLEEAFGKQNLAVITGAVTPAQRRDMVKSFQKGERRVAFISSAGKTGISLHHEELVGPGAQGRRHLIVTDYEWSAVMFKQELGRVDRTGQRTAPKVTMVSLASAAEKKYLATVANRMAAVGAFGKGSAEAATNEALIDFELGGQLDKAAFRRAYRESSRATQNWFMSKAFADPNDPTAGNVRGEPPAEVQHFVMDLQFMPIEVANEFFERFWGIRQQLIANNQVLQADFKVARTRRGVGQILRTTNLADQLQLHEIQDEGGVRYGVVVGLVTDYIDTLAKFLPASPTTGTPLRTYVTVRVGDENVAGLEVRPSRVQALARAFGKVLGVEQLASPEAVREALKAGEVVPVGERLFLRERGRDGRIQIVGPQAGEAAALKKAGAIKIPIGDWWQLPEDKLGAFLTTYPVNQTRREAGEEPNPPRLPGQGAGTAALMGRPSSPDRRHFQTRARLLAETEGSRPLPPESEVRVSREALTRQLEALHSKMGTIPGLRRILLGRVPLAKALAVFFTKGEHVRARVANDIEVFAHEVAGHHIHKYLFGDTTLSGHVPILQAFRHELDPLAYQGAKDTLVEGFAEFMRLYLTDVEAARDAAPGFTDAFEQYAASKDPELLGMLQAFQRDYTAWAEQPTRIRTQAMIVNPVAWRRLPTWEQAKHIPGGLWRRFYTAIYNDQYVASLLVREHRAQGRVFAASEDAEIAARLSRGSNGVAELFLERGVVDPSTNEVVEDSKGLNAILEPIVEEWEAWQDYAVRARAVEFLDHVDNPNHQRAAQMYLAQAGISENRLRETVEEDDTAHPSWRRVMGDVQTWNEGLLHYAGYYGLFSPEALARIREMNQMYVPWFRWFGEEELTFKSFLGLSAASRERHANRRAAIGQTTADTRQPTYAIRGSGRSIVSPIYSLMQQAFVLTALAHRARVGRLLVDTAAGLEGGGDIAHKIPAPRRPIRVDITQQIRGTLRRYGFEIPEDLEREFAEVWIPQRELREGEITIWRDGKREHWWVNPELYTLMKNLDAPLLGPWSRMAVLLTRWTARALRSGVILRPSFWVMNVFRDQTGAAAQAQVVPFVDFGRMLYLGLAAHVKAQAGWGDKGEAFYQLVDQFKASGAAQMALVGATPADLEKRFKALLAGKDPAAKSWHLITHPLDLLEFITNLSEVPTRLAIFERTLKHPRPQDVSEKARREYAALQARDNPVDYARRGALLQTLRAITPFLGPGLQGHDRMRRALFSKDGWKRGWAIGSVITLISLALRLLIETDDEEYLEADGSKSTAKQIYERLEPWQRWLFFIVITKQADGMAKVTRIPKPFDWGWLFATVPELLVLDPLLKQQPTVARDLERALWAWTPNLAPTFPLPLYENRTNWSRWRDRPIVPAWLDEADPAEQWTAGTSDVARALAPVTGRLPLVGSLVDAPLEVDNVIRGWFGPLTADAIHEVEYHLRRLRGAAARPERRLMELPGFNAFHVRYPSPNAAPIERFYDRLGELRTFAETYDVKARRSREEARAYLEAHRAQLRVLDRAAAYAEELAELSRRSRGVWDSERIPPARKRLLIDQFNIKRIRLAEDYLTFEAALEHRLSAPVGQKGLAQGSR